MAFSYVTYNGDGVTGTFNVPFQYLDQAHVVVTINGTPQPIFTWPSPATINIAIPPVTGDMLRIERVTPRDQRAHNFVDGSVLTAGQLDSSLNHLFYVMQEAFDALSTSIRLTVFNTWDAVARRLTNLADPVAAQDAVTKAYGDANYGGTSATNAQASANASATSAAQASTAAVNAKTSETNAKVSETNAAASAASVVLAQPNGIATLDAKGYPVQGLNAKGGRSVWLGVGVDLTTLPATYPSGIYDCQNPANAPAGITGYCYITLQIHSFGATFAVMRLATFGANNLPSMMYERTVSGGVWSVWERILDEGMLGQPNGVASLDANKAVRSRGMVTEDFYGGTQRAEMFYNGATTSFGFYPEDLAGAWLPNVPLELTVYHKGAARTVWHDGHTYLSGWITPTRAVPAHILTLAHGLGKVPDTIQLTVHDLTNGHYILHPGSQGAQTAYLNPLAITSDAANIYLHIWNGDWLCRWWNGATGAWVAHDNCKWQIQAR